MLARVHDTLCTTCAATYFVVGGIGALHLLPMAGSVAHALNLTNLPHVGNNALSFPSHCNDVLHYVWSSWLLLEHFGVLVQLPVVFLYIAVQKHGVSSLAACHPCMCLMMI